MVRKITGHGSDAESTWYKSSLQLQNISTFIYRYVHLPIALCFLSLVIRPGVLFFVFRAGSHFPDAVPVQPLFSVLPVSTIFSLVTTARVCFVPTEGLRHWREEKFALPSRSCSAPCFHLDSPSKSKGHQRFPPYGGDSLACSKAKQWLPYTLGSVLEMRLSASLMGLGLFLL